MGTFRFEYVQPRLSCDGESIIFERKPHSVEAKDDEDGKLQRDAFLEMGSVFHKGRRHNRTYVAGTFSEHTDRKIPDPPRTSAAEDYDRKAVHAAFEEGVAHDVASLGQVAQTLR